MRPEPHAPISAQRCGSRAALVLPWALLLAAALLGACRTTRHGDDGPSAGPPPAEEPQRASSAPPTDAELRRRLSARAYEVTQQGGTEPPFDNEYWNDKRAGIYVDVVSTEPLFSSLDKFDSGTGWPSFARPLEPGGVLRRDDSSHGMSRTEVRSSQGDSHLGHLFDDGPGPGGARYCINSAALRLVPVAELAAEGYGAYLESFERAGLVPEGTERHETATLAGGCFWGMEEILRGLPGVVDTEVGYTGGSVKAPSYVQVSGGQSGHAEAVRVVFDPAELGFEKLLELFFRMHDPTTPNRQGNDVGAQYRSAIFYGSERQKHLAEQVTARVDGAGKWPRPVATEIAAASTFWPAEDNHQDYLQSHPGGYTCHYLRDE